MGMLVSPSGFTDEARWEELRISESGNCIVMLESRQLLELMSSPDIDDALESIVRSALLR